MMTKKQREKLQSDEATLMADWRTRWQEKHAEYLHFTNLWYYETDTIAAHHKTLAVSMPHPNRSDRRWTLELENVLRITGRL